LFIVVASLASCGNYSNEDLEFMNAVPARSDLTASMPRAMLTVNEAELSRDTHDVIRTFNGALEFLKIADLIRTYPPTSRIPDGRIWGPVADDKHPGWQWRFVMTRDPSVSGTFNYTFDEQPIGTDQWYELLNGSFVATGGARRGIGHFSITTDALWAVGFPFDYGADGSLLRQLDIKYSTADYPISVVMHLEMYPDAVGGNHVTTSLIAYTYEALESGRGAMQFVGTDATGKSFSVVSGWLASGRGRADATYVDPANGVNLTWTECWNDSFMSVYDNKPWDPTQNGGDAALCPDVSTP
jgi:hypothetical protein